MEAKKYRKTAIVEAFVYDGDFMYCNGKYYVPDWAVKALDEGVLFYQYAGDLYVKTLEGELAVSHGDYLVQGVDGEIYPCKPEIFEKSYEEV